MNRGAPAWTRRQHHVRTICVMSVRRLLTLAREVLILIIIADLADVRWQHAFVTGRETGLPI